MSGDHDDVYHGNDKYLQYALLCDLRDDDDDLFNGMFDDVSDDYDDVWRFNFQALSFDGNPWSGGRRYMG
jgi:hypothetical protein